MREVWVLQSFLMGFGAGLVVLSPAEWLVHKHLLHAPRHERTWYNKGSSFAHQDVHHAAFMGPEHYYRDITNEHETIHFGKIDVVTILGIGGGAGFLGHKAYDVAAGTPALNSGDAGAALGMMSASLIGYLGYEVSHHYMHVIGERRLAINRAFGDALQPVRDGRLRFTKPLLDDICNTVEAYVDENARRRTAGSFTYDASLEERFTTQAAYNTENGVELNDVRFGDVVRQVAAQTLAREKDVRAALTPTQYVRHALDRKVQRVFRGSDTWVGRYFRHIDNHHFLHHCNYKQNLNVFLTWADSAFGTKLDSSAAALDTLKKKHLICPNSPDLEKFERP